MFLDLARLFLDGCPVQVFNFQIKLYKADEPESRRDSIQQIRYNSSKTDIIVGTF